MTWFTRGLLWGLLALMVLLVAGGGYEFLIALQHGHGPYGACQWAIQAVIKLFIVFWPVAIIILILTLAFSRWL
ncbi:MAG: hypothetical protein PWP70_24 [Moorella sp. (in: firmicutes)]|nr:hypothetical protein [Moorella sp. (in: firmicutes)]